MNDKCVDQDVVIGLDIGTSKVLASAGIVDMSGEMEVIGVGYANSKGLDKGVVINIDEAAKSIRQAIDNLELMVPACGEVRSIYAGLTGKHVKSYNAQGVVAVRDREVATEDIDRALDPAQVVSTQTGRNRVLHIIPQEYIVDDQRGVKEPQSMLGSRLEAKVHVVTCAANIAKNLEKCIEHAGLKLEGMMLNSLAVSDAVLTQEEKNNGVCLIDIGAGTSDIAVFSEGTVKHTDMIPLAGRAVSNDISYVLQIPMAEAEPIKLRYGTAFSKQTPVSEILRIKRFNSKDVCNLKRALLAQIIEARYKELFGIIRNLLKRTGYENRLVSGLVLTGGAAGMDGLKQLAEEIFQKQVRIAVPDQIEGLRNIIDDPSCATSVGLLMQGMEASRGNFRRRPIGPFHEFRQWITRLV